MYKYTEYLLQPAYINVSMGLLQTYYDKNTSILGSSALGDMTSRRVKIVETQYASTDYVPGIDNYSVAKRSCVISMLPVRGC